MLLLEDKLHRTMWKGVNDYDRVILIFSKDSLEREGVLNALDRALEREQGGRKSTAGTIRWSHDLDNLRATGVLAPHAMGLLEMIGFTLKWGTPED